MNLYVILPVFIFFLLFIMQFVASVIMFLIFSLTSGVQIDFHFIHPPVLLLLIVSLFSGLILTAVINRILLRPMATLAAAINQLGKGNFKTRIHLDSLKELSNISNSFNSMAEELENTEILRTDFINNFSHEFKTPLSSLKGFAKLLKDPDLTKEERDEYLDIIIQEAGRLSTLSGNILNLSKVEKMTIITEQKTFNLAEQIRRSILLLEPKWSKKDLSLDIDLEEISFTSNPDLLNQVWVNLLDNSIKFSPEGASLSVRLFRSKGGICFRLEDHGCGIPEESLYHIFDKFYQADTSHTMEGNGIGLAIVKRILTLCGGSIEVDSRPGEGTAVAVRLPEA